MMSAAQSQSTLTLEALECHFTWALYDKKDKMLRLKDKLKDIGTEEGNSWLGHIYNLQGFIQYKLGSFEEALRLFSRATEALHQLRNAEEGPWLVVNYGNLAWLHHHLGEEDKSQDYLSKVEALIKKYPSPLQDELHPEILAEKAWTLMNFDKDRKLLAADYFQRAIRMKPDMVQWQTSRVVGLISVHKHSDTDLDAILEEIRMAREEDPENLYLAACYLHQRVKRGKKLEDEAHELAKKILLNPVSSYSGMKPLVMLYRELELYDDAIDVVEEALKKHPDEPYLKKCAALCYKWKITSSRDGRPNQRIFDRAISLTEEVISLSPHCPLSKEIDLANLHAKSVRGLTKADEMYKELLEADLDPEEKQLLYNSYAKYLFYDRKDRQKSIRYHMRAAEIPHQGFYRQNSIKTLQKIAEQGRHRMCREIQECLANLQDSDAAQSQSKLEALECHFTWGLDPKKDKILRLKGRLEDIGTEEGNSWLSHIYNLQGFIQYKLGSFEEAQRLFSRATEALHQLRNAKEGPWLVVNYGNLAWLHHHLREEDKSQDYLSKVEALIKKYPSPLQDELHPEILAEKAWTLMNFDKYRKLLAADYFQRAIRMKPDMVQWQTSRLVGLMSVHKHSDTDLEAILEEIRLAGEKDPENFYLAACYLHQRVRRGEKLKDEAHELAKKILLNPVSSYSGMIPLVMLYRELKLYDDAVNVVEEALEKHPDEPYLKRCAALCYKWKITSSRDGRPNQRMLDRAISLTEDVISLYPHSSLSKRIDLANLHAKSDGGLEKADQMYKELLEADLDPAEKQLLYNSYAKYLYYDQKDSQKSIRCHMKAAEIPQQGFYRQNSIKLLQKIAERGRDRMCGEIQEFLANLQDSESE